MDVAFLFEIIKNRPAFTSTQSASHRKIEFGIVLCFFIYNSFTYSIFEKIGQHLLPLKVRHATLIFELIYLNVYLDSCLFLGLNLIP